MHDDIVGKRLGHYDVRSLAGAGGMGQVYRARDTRLGRDVALKVLPPEWITDPDRLARLEREARLLASLNHPNIATIHGLEDAAYPGLGGKQQVSSGGASHVRWRSDGRELFYVTRGGDLMAAEVTARGDTLVVGRVQRLFGGILSVDAAQGYLYDVVLEATSTRFIVAEGVERRNAAPEALTLVENWTGLLKTVP